MAQFLSNLLDMGDNCISFKQGFPALILCHGFWQESSWTSDTSHGILMEIINHNYQLSEWFLTMLINGYPHFDNSHFHVSETAKMYDKNRSWNCYLSFRLILGFFDLFTDIIQGVGLIHIGHVYWGTMTLLFPLNAVFCSCFSTLIARWRHGNPTMSALKFSLLSLKNLATIFEGFFESGPELILQMILIFHGVHNQDISVIADKNYLWSWQWFKGISSSLQTLVGT